MSKFTDPEEIRNELRATCSRDVNRLLLGWVEAPLLNRMEEEALLKHIKAITVEGVHKEVHRQTFMKLTQSEGESITDFAARLKEQATLCEFKVACQSQTCDCMVSYSEDMVCNQMVSGLWDKEHQNRILAEADIS